MSCVRAGLMAIVVAAGVGTSFVGMAASVPMQRPALYDADGVLIGAVLDGDVEDGRVQTIVDFGGDPVVLPADRYGFHDDSGGGTVFFTGDDCSGDAYVWNTVGNAGNSNGWKRSLVLPGQVVGINKLVYVPDRTSPFASVEYNSRLVQGGCIVQSGSDDLVKAIRKGSVRTFKKPFQVQELH